MYRNWISYTGCPISTPYPHCFHSAFTNQYPYRACYPVRQGTPISLIKLISLLEGTIYKELNKVFFQNFIPDIKRLLPKCSGTLIQSIPVNSNVHTIAFDATGSLLAAGLADGTILLLDPNTGQINRTLIDHRSSASSIAFDSSGSILASGSSNGTITLWNPSTGEALRSFIGHNNPIHTLIFSSNGSQLASESDDGLIIIWDPRDGTLIQTFDRNTNFSDPNSIALDPTGCLLAYGISKHIIKIADRATGRQIRCLNADRTWPLTFNPTRFMLAAGSKHNTINILDAATGKLIRSVGGHLEKVDGMDRFVRSPGSHIDAILSMAFNPSGTLLASGSKDRTIKLWDPDTGDLIQTLFGHTRAVRSVAFNPAGSVLASGANDKTIKLWTIATPS